MRGRRLRQVIFQTILVALGGRMSRTGVVVVSAAMFNADLLGNRDRDVIDETLIPNRLEQRIRESKRENVLNRLFAEIVVDAKNLRLVKAASQSAIQLPRRFQVVADRLFNHDARPLAIGGEAGIGEQFRDLAEQRPWHGEVKNVSRFGVPIFVELSEPRHEVPIRFRVLKITRQQLMCAANFLQSRGLPARANLFSAVPTAVYAKPHHPGLARCTR